MAASDILPISSDRITLRRLRPEDLGRFQAYRHDPAVGLYQGWAPQSDENSARFIGSMALVDLFVPGEWFQVGVAAQETDELIGDIGICVKEGGLEAEIGFSLRADSQGMGFGSEAVSQAITCIFDNTTVERIIAITDSRNEAAIRLLEGLGLEREQVLQAVFRGESCVEYLFSASRKT